ncbi:hypothetical protein Tco_0748995 [Tanacetum coccineum]|uniref:Uncharacterized protein n=1 Tax=Tanacetum coccineum TaxID=301880 RepID=A0ABQ4YX70_9ASTR
MLGMEYHNKADRNEKPFHVVIDRAQEFLMHQGIHHFADVPEILHAYSFGTPITKIKGSGLICKMFEEPHNSLADLGYLGPLHNYYNMFVDHMHQPLEDLWQRCINKGTLEKVS